MTISRCLGLVAGAAVFLAAFCGPAPTSPLCEYAPISPAYAVGPVRADHTYPVPAAALSSGQLTVIEAGGQAYVLPVGNGLSWHVIAGTPVVEEACATGTPPPS